MQELVPGEDLPALADALAQKEIVIATELGGGLIPVEKQAREKREAAGRLACLLAARADTVIRVCCGLPQLLKGELAVKVWLIRHGLTRLGEEKRYQGALDTGLSDEGRAEEEADFAPERVYVSPLRRATETAAILFPEVAQIVL